MPYTHLSNGENSGAATFRVQNINGFAASYAVQAGATGEDKSEIQLLGASAPSGTALTLLGTATYDHPTDTPIYAVKFDKIIFYRSTTGSTGTDSAAATVAITPNGTYTVWDDTTAQSTYAYRTAFYNSVTTETSAKSDWIVPGGPSFYSLSAIRNRIRNKVFNSTYIAKDEQINDWVNEWLEEMSNSAIKVNEDYLIGSTNVNFVATTGVGTITATDFKQVRRLWTTTDGATYYEAIKAPINNIQPQAIYDPTTPVFAMYDDNKITVFPNSTAGTAAILYYRLPTQLVNDDDTIPVSMQNYSKSFVSYGLAQALNKDGKDGAPALEEAKEMKASFVNEIQPRTQTNQSYITVDEDIQGDDMPYGY